MLSLNLVSQELRREIRLRRIYGLIKKTGYIFIIIAIITASFLLAAKVILQNNFNRIVEQTSLVTRNSQGYNNKVREINNRLNAVKQIQDGFIVWSSLLENLAEMTPPNVSFSFVKLEKDAKTIRIKGRAVSRADLLELKQNLENSGIFTNLDFPIKNILKQSDIDFEINAKLNL